MTPAFSKEAMLLQAATGSNWSRVEGWLRPITVPYTRAQRNAVGTKLIPKKVTYLSPNKRRLWLKTLPIFR
jgi:hypothetical protein